MDEINEQSREYEMKRQAVQMAAEHLEQLSGAMRGYLKRDLNEKASAIIREITGGKYTKLVTDEKLHVSLVTDEKLVEIEQVSRGNSRTDLSGIAYGGRRTVVRRRDASDSG